VAGIGPGSAFMFKPLSKRISLIPLRIALLLALAMFATEKQAHAYTDPGTGALIWQMLVAGLVGVGFYFRRITAWFKNRKGPRE